MDKSNVLEVSQLWREVVTRVGEGYPDVELSHMCVVWLPNTVWLPNSSCFLWLPACTAGLHFAVVDAATRTEKSKYTVQVMGIAQQ